MRKIKYRQPLFLNNKFNRWHYWGFISDGHFASPELTKMAGFMEGASNNSQQLVGLKDKKGDEIYEGDIVMFKQDEGFFDSEYIGEVIFDCGCFSIKINHRKTIGNTITGEKAENRVRQYDLGQIHPIFNFDIKVIGNIYENPNLVTKSSADDFPVESLISVKQDSAESQNQPANDERKKEADFV